MTSLSLDRRTVLHATAAAVLCGPRLSAVADTPATPTRFWTWGMPRGAARIDGRVQPLVRVQTHQGSGGEAAADIAKTLRSRLLLTPDIAVTLQGFGMAQGDPHSGDWQRNGTTPLMQAWKDGVDQSASPAWWITPWYAHGIDACSAWIKTLIDSWPLRGEAALPPPSRFIFDTEHWPGVGQSAMGVGQTFVAMQSDRRWDSEVIPGFDRPISELWEAAGRPPVDPTQPWFALPNREWAKWYQGLCLTSADAAMNLAAYQSIREAFPGCLCTNYGSATSFDGLDGRFDVMPGNPWMQFTHRASADLLGPVCYWSDPKDAEDMSLAEASLARANRRVQAMMLSYGGVAPSKIVPWIQLPGETRVNFGSQATQTPELTAAMVKLLTGLGVREFVVWYGSDAGSERDWAAMMTAIEQG